MGTPLKNSDLGAREKTTVMPPVSSTGAKGPRSARGRHHSSGAAGHGGHAAGVTSGAPAHWTEGSHGGGPSKKRGRGALIALGVLAGLTAAVYIGGVVLFSNVCYPNTSIAGVDVSLMGRDTCVSRVETSAASYRLTVEGDGFTWTYEPESANEVIDAEAAVTHVIEGNEAFAWPARLLEALGSQGRTGAVKAHEGEKDAPELDDIELPASFDRDAFLADLGAALEAYNVERTGTFDAAGAYDEEAGKFTLEKARSNQKLDVESIKRAALVAVSTLDGQVKLDDESLVPLANGATEQQIQAAIDAANELIGTDVDLKMGGNVVATLDGATFVKWMTFDEQLKPMLNTEPLAQWVHELAASKLDTIGCERTYTRADGKTVTVSGGTYGWNSNEAELVKRLNEAVANKEIGEIEVPTLQNAATWTAKGERDWGAYCDIDLTEQRCRYYDASGALAWESGCVTGNPNKDWSTPTGAYILNGKSRDQVLLGTDDNKDGKPDYRSPVDYWMPFVGNMIGLHDANWQPASVFSNPQAYTWAGSRGCVNLPTDKAAELYGIINPGDCVIVHW